MKLWAYVPGTAAWRLRKDEALCREASRRIQEIADGELPPDRAELKRHLDACERCNHQEEAVLELKRAIARVSDQADPELVEHLEDFARRLCAGEEPGSDRSR